MKLGDPQLLKSALESMALGNNVASALSGGASQNFQEYPPVDRVIKYRYGLALMKNAQFSFSTIEDAENLAVLLAGCFPEPERVVQGLAELMVNAIEHGNLGIGHAMKADLCNQGLWGAEIKKRLENPVLKCREAEATIVRKDGGTYVVIADQGEGFDWQNYLKIDPARAGMSHGRGIAMASSISFDKLTYNEKGNKAIGYVADSSALQW